MRADEIVKQKESKEIAEKQKLIKGTVELQSGICFEFLTAFFKLVFKVLCRSRKTFTLSPEVSFY
jgi:hypothetical protein